MVAGVAKWMVVLALTLSLGAHWALLQSVAWVGMAIRYSQDGNVGEALSKTFDGEHPCKLCHFVEEGRKAESRHEQTVQLEAKKQILCETVQIGLFPPLAFSSQPASRQSAAQRSQAPPLPPPRNLPA